MDGIEKTGIIFIITFAIVLFCFSCSGCATSRNTVGKDIIEYQQQIDRLEEELRYRDRAIEDCIREIGVISERSGNIEGTVDDVIELFNSYQRAVERLLQYYRTAAGISETRTGDTCTDDNVSANNDSR